MTSVTEPDGDELLQVGQVAARFGVKVKSVRRWTADGLLPAVRTSGGHRRYRAADVAEAFATRLTTRPDPAAVTRDDVWARRRRMPPMTHPAGPDRVVDRTMTGWWLMPGPDGAPGYASLSTSGSGRTLTYAELDAAHGPLRPVEPMSDADRDVIAGALRAAGTKAVGTLAAALGAVWEDGLGHRYGQEPPSAQLALIAGRPSSWEAQLLLEVTYFGRDLLHGSPKRIDADALGVLRVAIRRAVDNEGPHHELAATLGGIVVDVADEREEGWLSVVDQWLRPRSPAKYGAALVYRLFYATSPRYDPAHAEAKSGESAGTAV